MTRKKRTSLDAIFDDPAEVARPPASTDAPIADRVAPLPRQDPAGERPRRRTFEEQHKKQSVYLAEPVWEQLRKLAFDERRKMHDYLMDGLDSIFRKRGLPSIAELEKELRKEDA
jgi:hypothetical protein